MNTILLALAVIAGASSGYFIIDCTKIPKASLKLFKIDTKNNFVLGILYYLFLLVGVLLIIGIPLVILWAVLSNFDLTSDFRGLLSKVWTYSFLGGFAVLRLLKERVKQK